MVKSNKFLSLFLAMTVCLGLFTVPAFADNAIGNIKYTRSSTKITATVEIDATSESRILVVRSYDKNGLQLEIETAANAPSDTALSATVSAGVYEVRASVIDGNGKSLTPDAVYNADSTDLKYIRVNGELLAEFSNEKDEYFYKVTGDDFEVEAVPQDATTEIAITKDTVNRKAKITVKSAFGHIRTISLTFYKEESDKYKLIDMKYKIGDTEYTIPDFNPDVTVYENIEVPENTMSLTVMPRSAGNIDVQVMNYATTEINGVSLGRYLNSSDIHFEYPRTALGNVITLKNESGTAKITVSSGNVTTEYLFTFRTPKQPRLLEMNYVGASSDSEKPTFVSGCAVFNDNGTTFTSDWGYSACQISKELEGGSCILFRGNNKSGGWWQTTSSGEYFNFKVDRACTVYMLSCANMTAGEWGEAGWTRVNSGTVPKFTGTVLGKEYSGEELGDNSGLARRMRKDWNDYSSPAVYAGAIMYNSARAKDYRCINPGIKETEALVTDGVVYRNFKHAYKKHFDAEEEIKIFHTGNKSELGCVDFVVIKWDNEDNSLLYTDKMLEEAAVSEVITEPLTDSSIGDTSYVFGVDKSSFDSESGVWKDASGKKNDMPLGTDDNSFWVNDTGFKASAAASGATTAFPQDVQSALKSGNATIQFKLADFTSAAGKFNIIFSNNSANYMLCTKDKGEIADLTNVNMRFNIGSTGNNVQPTGVDLTKTNTIVFDKSNGKLYWYNDSTQIFSADVAYPSLSGIDNINLSYTGTGSNYIGSNATFEQIKVFNAALSKQEVEALFDSTESSAEVSANLKINAQTDKETVSVILLNNGYTFDDVKAAIQAGDSDALGNAVLSFVQEDSKDGKISSEIPMAKGALEGNYTVMVDGVELTASYTENLTGKVSDYANNIEYFADSVAYNSLSNKNRVKAYTQELLAGVALSADDESVAKIEAAVRMALLIEKLNENLVTDIEEIKADTASINPIIPISELEQINDKGKTDVLSAIKSKSFASVAEYKKALAGAMFVSEINSDTTKLSAADKLTYFNTYASVVGLNTSAISGKSATEALAKLAAADSATISDMQTKLNAICASLPSQTPISTTTGGGGGGGGGGVSVINGSASGSAGDKSGFIPGVQFTDMDAYSWAKNAVQALRAKGIISGYADMTFKPANSVTRAEFITMMVKAYMPDEKDGSAKFSDVSAGDWFFKSVMTAFENGIISGVTEDEFMPNNKIKRQDMAVILYNLAMKLGKAAGEETEEFADFASVSDYAKQAVAFLKAAGVVNGDETGSFNPQSYANRAEAAQMIYTFMEFVGEGALK